MGAGMKKFNLSLDDFNPHPGSGFYFESIWWCDKLIEKYPEIKIDLFVPGGFARLNDPSPFFLSKYPKWVEKVKRLPSNYRINLHTYNHRRSRKDFKWHRGVESANNEWENLTYNEAVILLNLIEDEFKKVGLTYSNVFRPSGWHIGCEAAKLLTKRGYIIAGDTKYYKVLKDKVPGMKWVSYNWDMTGPCKVKGDVVAFGHTSEWCNNYMNRIRYNLIVSLLDSDKFDFRFIEELV